MARSSENSGENDQVRRAASEQSGNVGSLGPVGESPAAGTPTGRYLIAFQKEAVQAGVRALTEVAGLEVASMADFEGGAVDANTLAGAQAFVFNELQVAVVDAPPDQIQVLSVRPAEDTGIVIIEPERVVEAFGVGWIEESALSTTLSATSIPTAPATTPANRVPVEYLLGYREAINHLVDRVLNTRGVSAPTAAEPGVAFDESQLTWGIQVTRTAESRFTGKGIRVAVLDTGFDLGHPDFVGRHVVSQSFIPGEEVQDGHGHGTHCIGTACGPRQPGQLPRYGVAYEADIFAGKVLSNRGSGSDGGILAGIEWAIRNNCFIISMSLGAPTQPGQGFSRIYELVAQRALTLGTLIIAAAGNESQRPGVIMPVGHPANCPSIIAVGALDERLQVARFSCGGINPSGGQVDIGGPGVRVRSSLPRPKLYGTFSGTSMATPHVAGLAALHAEANPDMRGASLGWLLLQSARRLELPTRDVGAGLVQAP